MTLTRDGLLLWLLAFAAAGAYLVNIGTPPWEWEYQTWLATVNAAILWGIGKLQTSPMPSTREVALGKRDSGERL